MSELVSTGVAACQEYGHPIWKITLMTAQLIEQSRPAARGRRRRAQPVPAEAGAATPPLTGFAALGVPAPLVEALTGSGVSIPFPIQAAVLPDALSGTDILGRGRTGSGKTLGFSIPLIARLADGSRPALPASWSPRTSPPAAFTWTGST